jgi:fibronectin-binding autotransporter adhesin
MRLNVYDNLKVIGGTSLAAQSFSGSSAVNGLPVPTFNAETAALYAFGAAPSGTPTAAALVVTLQESATGNASWTNALDNTGTVIGFTLTPPLTLTANTTSGSNQLSNFSSLTGIYVGQQVSGTGIPTGTVITAINNTGTASTSTATLSANATSSNTSETLTLSAENIARIEGLNGLNRKPYLRAVITPSFTGGSSPAILGYAQILLGNDQQLPVDAAVSNT